MLDAWRVLFSMLREAGVSQADSDALCNCWLNRHGEVVCHLDSEQADRFGARYFVAPGVFELPERIAWIAAFLSASQPSDILPLPAEVAHQDGASQALYWRLVMSGYAYAELSRDVEVGGFAVGGFRFGAVVPPVVAECWGDPG